jgi:hypothetical protein
MKDYGKLVSMQDTLLGLTVVGTPYELEFSDSDWGRYSRVFKNIHETVFFNTDVQSMQEIESDYLRSMGIMKGLLRRYGATDGELSDDYLQRMSVLTPNFISMLASQLSPGELEEVKKGTANEVDEVVKKLVKLN